MGRLSNIFDNPRRHPADKVPYAGFSRRLSHPQTRRDSHGLDGKCRRRHRADGCHDFNHDTACYR
jgi:hypothetical protein